MSSLPPVSPLPDAVEAEIVALVEKSRVAKRGVILKLANWAGSQIESAVAALPMEARPGIEEAIRKGLLLCCSAAALAHGSRYVPTLPSWGHKVAASATGMAGGSAGLVSTTVELPVTIGLIFAAMQKAAAAEGFDPNDDKIKAECIRIFGDASPLAGDEDADLGFIAARLTLNGAALQSIIAKTVPKLAAILTQKLGAQALPIWGAFAGGSLNYAFASYYQEMASVHFRLHRLAQKHGEEAIRASFALAASRRPLPTS